MRYFFDTRDGERLLRDDEGMELDGIEAAEDEAKRGLADFARDAVPHARQSELAVEVRDEGGVTVLRAVLKFETNIIPLNVT